MALEECLAPRGGVGHGEQVADELDRLGLSTPQWTWRPESSREQVGMEKRTTSELPEVQGVAQDHGLGDRGAPGHGWQWRAGTRGTGRGTGHASVTMGGQGAFGHKQQVPVTSTIVQKSRTSTDLSGLLRSVGTGWA